MSNDATLKSSMEAIGAEPRCWLGRPPEKFVRPLKSVSKIFKAVFTLAMFLFFG
jgi:hypothetical protein